MFLQAPFNIALCLMVLGFCWASYYFYENKLSLIGAVIFYFIQLAECYGGRTYGFFKNQMHISELENYLQQNKNKAPLITMIYQNVRIEHKHGKEKEVNAEKFEQPFRYQEFIDESPDFNTFESAKSNSLTRLELACGVRYSPVASSSLEAQQCEFERNSKRTDKGHSSTSITTGDLLNNVIIYKSQPLILNKFFYFICNVCMMSWVIRVMLVFSSQRIEYSFQKYILK